MKVTVVGAGTVGTEVVGMLFAQTNLSEIVLVNRSRDKAEAEVDDFSHVTSFFHSSNIKLKAGDYADSAGSDIVVMTAGANIKPGQKREVLLEANAGIVMDVMGKIADYCPDAIVIMATNPVDVCCTLLARHTPFDPSKIIGTGTLIDTARFNKILSQRFHLDPKNIVGHVLGQHGPASFIPWSMVNICGMCVDTFCGLNNFPRLNRNDLLAEAVNSGLHILNRKGNTNHGIAATVVRIIRSIIMDENSLVPAGVYAENYCGVKDVVLSIPAVINRSGVDRLVHYPFTPEELEQLHHAAGLIRSMTVQAEKMLQL